ncbi:MAG: hypothetical protein HY867_01070 [Chloroflexi bacterium]|nr:hypothetical protein [Chloroflexota bacterium]
MSETAAGLIVSVIGVLVMVGSAMNWRVVTHSGKLFNMIFGDKIARGIYFLVGAFLFVLGIGQILGMNWLGE